MLLNNSSQQWVISEWKIAVIENYIPSRLTCEKNSPGIQKLSLDFMRIVAVYRRERDLYLNIF